MLKFQVTCIVATLAVLLTSCESLDKTLNSADSALKAVNTGTVKGLAQIATADDPNAALKQAAKQRGEQYKDNPEALIADIRAAKRDFEKLMSFLTGHVGKTWGEKEVKVPTQTQYVKYTQNYKSRAVVDFDKGEIMVETLDDRDAKSTLRNAIVTTLLTPDDPRSVDLFSDQAVTLSNEKQPYLKGLVLDSNNKPITTPETAESFARNLITTQMQTRSINVNGKVNTSTFVKFAMVSNFSNKQAQKYSDVVKRFATQHKISQSLVYAIIRTESNFNPYAVSSAPAYGLMQLVPTSGGRDAYRKVTGQDQAPSKEYLFDPANNIELGTAYLNVLTYNQLEVIQNEVSREYCVISAYNTGSGNVTKAFSPDRRAAFDAINSAQPAAVYDKLRTNLPYAETRDYLQKVVGFRKQFVSLAE